MKHGLLSKLKSFQTVRKVWKVFRTLWKVSGQSEKFLDSLESFRIVCKVYG